MSFTTSSIGLLSSTIAISNIAGRNTINTGLFKIFLSGGIGLFATATVGTYINQAIAQNPSLAFELQREREKVREEVDSRRRDKKVLYHYSDRIAAQNIMATSMMRVTPQHSSGAPRGAYAADIKPWDMSYTQKELSALFYGGNINRDVSWFVAVNKDPFIHRYGTREYYIGSPDNIVPVDVVTIGKNLMLLE
ncbi:MAG: hypothetical protein J7J31_02800 [Helicobacteraceae bacterium]|nr:hypothetical protein [Helicobacteraceae bacterium]